MTFKKSAALLMAGMLALSLSFGCTKKDAEKKDEAPKAAGDTIKIGFLGAKTGDVAMFGLPSLNGMKLAAEEINAAGGVNGKKIEIVEEDDRGDKQEGAAVTQKLIARDGVVAIVGDPTSGIMKVAAPIAQKAQVVIMSGGSSAPGVVEIGDYVFRDTLLDSVAIPALLEYYAKNIKMKRVALITSDNNDYSVGMSQLFRDSAKKAGIEIVADEKIKDGDKDFSAQMTNIKAKKPELLFYSGYYTEAALMMKEARKQGIKANMLGGDGLFSPEFVKLGGSAVEGSMSYLSFSAEQDAPATKKYVETYKAKYNGTLPGLFDAQAYDAVKIIAAAMTETKSTDPKVFKTAIANLKNYVGAAGTLTIRENREPLKSPVCLLEIKNGEYKLKAQIPVTMK